MISVNKINEKTMYKFLYGILVFFIVFDGIRSNTVFSDYISPLKEFVVILIFLLILLKSKKISFIVLKSPISFFVYYVFFTSFIATINVGLVDDSVQTMPWYSSLVKTLEIFFIFYIFYFYRYLTGSSLIYFARMLVFYSLIFIIFSVFIYFYEFSFMKEFRPWYGRFGSGYPTADSFFLSVALLFSLFFYLYKSSLFSLIVMYFILFGLLFQITNTAFISLFFVIIFYLLFKNFSSNYSRRKNILFVWSIPILLVCVFLFAEAYSDDLGAIYVIASNKANFFLTGSDSISTEIRSGQVSSGLSYFEDISDFLFGVGTSAGSLVEIQYFFILVSFGIVGSVFYSFIFVWPFYAIFKNRNFSTVLLLAVTSLFGIVSLALITTYIFTTACLFFSIYGIVYSEYYNDYGDV